MKGAEEEKSTHLARCLAGQERAVKLAQEASVGLPD